MFHTPAQHQTDPTKAPGQITLTERACSTCAYQFHSTSKAPCKSCLPKAVELPNWTEKVGRQGLSRPDPGVKAIEALTKIAKGLEGLDLVDSRVDVNEAIIEMRDIAAEALSAVAMAQATDFVPVTAEVIPS